MDHENQIKIEALLNAVSSTRLVAMQFAEDSVGHLPEWPMLRSRLLRILGPKGIENAILEIMTRDFTVEVKR